MTDTGVDLHWYADFEHRGRPDDRVAVASVVLASLWLWWVGSVIGVVALCRSRRHPQPAQSRRWAFTGIVVGGIGIAIFALFVAPPVSVALSHRAADDAARTDLDSLAASLRGDEAGVPEFRVSGARAAPWALPGMSGVSVVGPETPSRNSDTISAEVWGVGNGLGDTARPSEGVVVYAAVQSSTGTCFVSRQADDVERSTLAAADGPCTADQARSAGSW